MNYIPKDYKLITDINQLFRLKGRFKKWKPENIEMIDGMKLIIMNNKFLEEVQLYPEIDILILRYWNLLIKSNLVYGRIEQIYYPPEGTLSDE